MAFSITAIYAGLLGLLLLVLSVPVMLQRRRLLIGVGDGGDASMLRLMRVQANFVEYAPLALMLLFALEGLGYAAWTIHALGIALLAGRIAHAQGLRRTSGASAGRVAGMVLTWTMIGVASTLCLVGALFPSP